MIVLTTLFSLKINNIRAANVNRVSREKVRISPRSFIAAVYAKNNCILSSLKNIKILKFLSFLTNFLEEM